MSGQVKELHDVLIKYAETPVNLAGHSWGAWLSYIIAAHYPKVVKKLILIDSGPFEEKYAADIATERLNRLSKENGPGCLN